MMNEPSALKPLSSIAKILLVGAGTVSLGLGIIGAFLPVLPTTPFVLLAAICYLRSSQRLYTKLMASRFANKHVHNVLAGKGIPLSVKVISLLFSATMIGYVSIFVTENVIVRSLLGLLYLVQLWAMIAWVKTSKHEDVSEIQTQQKALS